MSLITSILMSSSNLCMSICFNVENNWLTECECYNSWSLSWPTLTYWEWMLLHEARFDLPWPTESEWYYMKLVSTYLDLLRVNVTTGSLSWPTLTYWEWMLLQEACLVAEDDQWELTRYSAPAGDQLGPSLLYYQSAVYPNTRHSINQSVQSINQSFY